MGATRVEVAQQARIPVVERLTGLLQVVSLRLDVVGDDHLNDRLGATIGIRGANGTRLGDRNHVGEAGGVAIYRGRGGEDNVGDVVLRHGAKKGDGAADIDAIVLEGDLSGLANGLQTRFVNTCG